jgi:bisphosphoglycerate-independent phosphoglycerate mutase (AlkP superfamily)
MVGSKDTIPMPYGSKQMDELAELRRQVMGLWEEGTNDVLTFRMAQAYLQQNQPRVMWLALLNTDDWAHEDRYDRYIEYLHLADQLIGDLWNTLQSIDAYRDKTTLVITTDHGRGRQTSDWKEHDTATIPGTNDIWMAVIGPDTPDIGEVKTPGTAYQGQAASTMLHYLGIDYRLLGDVALPPVGASHTHD